MDKDSKIYIAGHRGLVGSAIYRHLKPNGFDNLITRTHQELDLMRQSDVEAFFESERPEYVFLAAAKVGGIWANKTYPVDFIYKNLMIQANVIHAAYESSVKKLLFLGSSCIYPRDCPQPMKEEYLLTSPLEPTNQPYALAKIAGIIQCEAYNRQHGTHFLAVMPTNLYGPNDNFDLETSHVLPALIRKFHLAKLAAQGDWENIIRDEKCFGPIPTDLRSSFALAPNFTGVGSESNASASSVAVLKRSVPQASSGHDVTLWGSGSPRREFLHVDDLADACLFLMSLDDEKFDLVCSGRVSVDESPQSQQHFDQPHALRPIPSAALPLINIGCGQDQTIKQWASLVSRLVGYHGEIVWDETRPDGMPRKLLDISRLKALGWSPEIGLEHGIRSTYEWYLDQFS